MALSGALVSTAVMGVLLVGAAAAVGRLRRRTNYTPRFRPRREGSAGVPATNVGSDTVAFGAAAALVLFAAAAVFLDAAALLFLAVAPALLAGFFAWGTYNIARSRGLPQAHSVGLSAWLFAVVLVGVVAVKLLVG